jgi:DNA-binding CsgD family transcriptional regulator
MKDDLGSLQAVLGSAGDGDRLCYEGCHVQSLLRMGEPVQSFDLRTRTKTGRPVWLNVSILSMNDAAGEKVAVHLFRDVTATKELLRLVHERLSSPQPAGGEPAAVLSRREIDMLRLMVEGLSTAAAAALHVSHSTVRNHVQNIFAKLGVHSRLEAVAHAARHRLL